MPDTRPGESVAVERGLLRRRFVDEGDMILGRALQSESGRELYEQIRNELTSNLPLDWAHGYILDDVLDYADKHALSQDDAKILLVSMMMKATLDFLMKELVQE